MSAKAMTFGEYVREKRVQKGLSLRRFAELVELSPTYISQVENGVQSPPTADRAKVMAVVLGEPEDVLVVLAGRVPDDISEILLEQPEEMAAFIRETKGLSPEQLIGLTEEVRRLKKLKIPSPK